MIRNGGRVWGGLVKFVGFMLTCAIVHQSDATIQGRAEVDAVESGR